MTQEALEDVGWSRSRWLLTIGLVFVAHLAAITWLSQRWPEPPLEIRNQIVFRMFDRDDAAALPALFFSTDPTAFVLANTNGFSGGAWLTRTPQDYDVPQWSEPLRWLSLPEEQLGQPFAHFVETNPPAPFQFTEKLPVRLGVLQAAAPPQTSRTQSVLRVEGPSLLLGAPPELPVWVHPEVLRPTTVQVLVDRSGEVQSARLHETELFIGGQRSQIGSGLAEADRAALALARGLRFQPGKGGVESPEEPELFWAKLEFAWHAKPPARQGATAGAERPR